MKEKVRIGCGQGFWGDLPDAPINLVNKGEIDYLVLDYLAEVTMSILQKQKSRDSKKGFAHDFVNISEKLLVIAKNKNVKIITNAGGVNPFECAKEIKKIVDKNNLNLKIGILHGDDILLQIENFIKLGSDFKNIDTNEDINKIKDKIVSANIYFGAKPICELLKLGADIIITGRVTDAGMTLAPLMYEFNWQENDYNKLASGIVAGHIIECGAQSTGGNCSYEWESIPDLANIGFPIVECFSDGSFFVTKSENSGGKVSIQTVTEQLVYEIGDPKKYLTPDCTSDFTSIQLENFGVNKIKVSDIKGSSPTEYYKVSIAYKDGFRAFGSLTYSWPNPLEKAKAADKIIRERIKNLNLSEIYTEFIGYNSVLGSSSENEKFLNEVMFKIAVHSEFEKDVIEFGKQIAPMVLTGPPGVTGYLGQRPKAMEVYSYWPCLILKKLVEPKFEII